MSRLDVSVVVPLYNEEESLPELVEWIDSVIKANNLTCEVILVDDGSTDRSWDVVEDLASKYSIVRGISFLRNYGKSAALYTGFEAAQGDVVITMDADLQDSPNEIPELHRMIVEDKYDLVSGWKQKRYDPIGKRLPSKFFNATARFVSGINLNDFNCGLKAYRRKVIKSIEVYGEMHRYIPVLAKQAGFKKIGEKVVEHQARKYGVTKFGWERFINGFLDLLSVVFVTKFGKKPMHFFGTLGIVTFLIGGILSCFMIGEKVYRLSSHLKVREVTDQPLFYISLTLVIIGIQLFLTGFLGDLVARSSSERNSYQIDKKI